jgi:hypothetical protein
LASPLVQVITQPISIMSILQVPITPMLQVQQVMPFIMQHIEHMPPCIIMQRFFIISAAVLSSHTIVHFIPLAIFSIFIVQRGIMLMPRIIAPPGIDMAGIMPMGISIPGIIPGIMLIEPMPIIPIRSPVIMLLMACSFKPWFI